MTDHLDVAYRLARRLADDAVHSRGRCTWVDDATLGPDLYGGTAGVGLVLIEIGSTTGDRRLADTGCAALRHALEAGEGLRYASAPGLFTGRAGIAVAAILGGTIAADEGMVRGGEAALSDPAMIEPGDRHDLLGGAAGRVLALLAGSARLGDVGLARGASVLAHRLVGSAASDSAGGLWWTHPSVAAHGPLTGVSHGGAGIAHALLEASVSDGDPALRRGAEAAIAYERGCIDPAGNYPDRRDLGAGAGFVPRSRIAWCHGAAGIALARRRAWVLTGDTAHRAEAAAALRLTVRWLRAAVATDRGDFCLCHGLAGNAAIAHACRDVVEADVRHGVDGAVAAVAELGIAEYHGSPAGWPCGSGRGEPPGLMNGIAGIARFYLGLHDDSGVPVMLPSADTLRLDRGDRRTRVDAPVPRHG